MHKPSNSRKTPEKKVFFPIDRMELRLVEPRSYRNSEDLAIFLRTVTADIICSGKHDTGSQPLSRVFLSADANGCGRVECFDDSVFTALNRSAQAFVWTGPSHAPVVNGLNNYMRGY